MRLIDTHCHINMPEAFPDVAQTIADAAAVGVDRLLVVGIDQPSIERALALAETYEGVWAIVGYHPNHTADFRPEDGKRVEGWLAHPKVVALGEIGLDFHWDYATPDQQLAALEIQMEIAVQFGKPVVFHCRKAYPELLDYLESRSIHVPYLFHCFSGSDEEADRALALGSVLGFDGPLTYKKSDALRVLASRIPDDRFVLETDSPYLPPEPFRGKPNAPCLVPIINRAMAACRELSESACAELSTANAERFFRLT